MSDVEKPDSKPARLRKIVRYREHAALALKSVIGTQQVLIARRCGVHRPHVYRWLTPHSADCRPAPLGILFALDDTAFDKLIAAVRAMRASGEMLERRPQLRRQGLPNRPPEQLGLFTTRIDAA